MEMLVVGVGGGADQSRVCVAQMELKFLRGGGIGQLTGPERLEKRALCGNCRWK